MSAPVVLLTVDTLRYDKFRSDHLPESFRIFEKDFVLYEKAFSHGVATPFAFPGIMAGTTPVGDGMIPQDVDTIPELFDKRYCTAFAHGGHLSEERGYARGWDEFRSSIGLSLLFRPLEKLDDYVSPETLNDVYDRIRSLSYTLRRGTTLPPPPYAPAERVSRFVKRRLQQHTAPLVWAHYMEPHLPHHPDTGIWDRDDDYDSSELIEFASSSFSGETILPSFDMFDLADSEEEEILSSLYRAQTLYFDRQLARLLRWMRTQRWYEDSMIILLSDHGELLGEYGRFGHPWDVDPYDELIHVPLAVKYPSFSNSGQRVERLVQLGDVIGTIADEFGVESTAVPDTVTPLPEPVERHVISVSNTAIRLIEPNGELIRRRSGETEKDNGVSDIGHRLVMDRDYPHCKTASGQAPGIKEARVRSQLQNLGYTT